MGKCHFAVDATGNVAWSVAVFGKGEEETPSL